jgi:hypothetical protein
MADWIRMRSSLLSNPRVTKMARVLLADRDFLDWLCPGCDVAVTRDESVTKRHIPVVTRVIVGGLLEVWSMVNDTAARDGIVRHASSRDMDETAGIPGFGAALQAVEWLEELPDGQGVFFPNFEEHNSPQKERSSVAKTGAERSREYRERKARERDAGVTKIVTPRDAVRDVTSDVTRDHREEESREEKRNTSSSLRSEEVGANKSRNPPRSRKEKTTLAVYLEGCKAERRKPVPPDHPIREFCRNAGITDEMLQVAWVVFRRQYLEDANYRNKTQRDWPAHFANAVRKRWGELWYHDTASNEVRWTSTGSMEKANLDAKAKAREEGEHVPA